MRRVALLALTLALPGCAYFESPFRNFDDFIGDTHTIHINTNRPVGSAENILRAEGRAPATEPLLPESGNIWPGPTPPEPTLEDIERQQNLDIQQHDQGPGTPNPSTPGQPVPRTPPGRVRGSSSPPISVPPGVTTPPVPPGPSEQVPGQPAPTGNSVITPRGPAIINQGGNGITTYTGPNGRTGIIVPNGNGTSTLIGPDGSVSTVPAPR